MYTDAEREALDVHRDRSQRNLQIIDFVIPSVAFSWPLSPIVTYRTSRVYKICLDSRDPSYITLSKRAGLANRIRMTVSVLEHGLQSVLLLNPQSALSEEWAGEDPERFSRAKLDDSGQLLEL